MQTIASFVRGLLMLATLLVGATAAAATSVPPLYFEPNVGQAAPEARFVLRGTRHSVAVTDRGLVMTVVESSRAERKNTAVPRGRAATVRMDLVGARRPSSVTGHDALPGVSHYLRGSDPAKWRTQVPQFGGVLLTDVYDGIDFHVYRKGAVLEYDLVVDPGADPGRIRLGFSGARRVALDDGAIVIETEAGTLRQEPPAAYQEVNGQRRVVPVRLQRVSDSVFALALGRYDRARPLVIDPILMFSDRLGSLGDDSVTDMAIDGAGNLYLVGHTNSADIRGPVGFQQQLGGGTDAFVMKLNPTTHQILYATYYGGEAYDTAWGIAVDANGRAYVVGTTASQSLYMRNGFQTAWNGGTEGFIVVFNATGSGVDYATFFGGFGANPWVAISDVAVKSSTEVWLTGETSSNSFTFTPNGFQRQVRGIYDAYVMKLDPSQVGTASVRYFSYYGGSANDQGSAIALVPGAAGVKIAGVTTSPDLPRGTKHGDGQPGVEDDWDVFVWRSTGASSFEGAVQIGGHDKDFVNAIALDASGNTYLAGNTESHTWPGITTASQQQQHGGGEHDGFFIKLNASGTSILYSTFLGGSSEDHLYGLSVTANGVVYLAGDSSSSNFPTTPNAVSRTLSPPRPDNTSGDAVLAKLNVLGRLTYGTYLGDSGTDVGEVVLNRGADTYLATTSNADSFPGAPPPFNTDHDAMISRFKAQVVFVVGTVTLGSGDVAIRNRLINLGFDVVLRRPSDLPFYDDSDRDLIVLSSTVTSTDVGNRFKASPVPVIVLENALQDDMAMTTGSGLGTSTGQTLVKMLTSTDPLSAGLSSTQTVVTSSHIFNWGQPASGAVRVATLNDTTKPSIYRYEAGATLIDGSKAANRRVGFFLNDLTASALNTNGWKLFDAAVKWAAGL